MLGKGGENKPSQEKPMFSSLERQPTDTEDLPFLTHTQKKKHLISANDPFASPLCFSSLFFHVIPKSVATEEAIRQRKHTCQIVWP